MLIICVTLLFFFPLERPLTFFDARRYGKRQNGGEGIDQREDQL
eukprot:gene11608-7997_t